MSKEQAVTISAARLEDALTSMCGGSSLTGKERMAMARELFAYRRACAGIAHPEKMGALLTILSYDPAEYGLDAWVENAQAAFRALGIDPEKLQE